MSAQTAIIPRGADGFYHPANEDQIVALVLHARANKLKVRCRGAVHSVAWAIYTDPVGEKNGVSVQTPPVGPHINIMLDQYNGLQWIDEEQGIVEVDAGIHLGYDRDDPSGVSTLENSLLYQAFLRGWTLSDLGGITHQTVGGFLSTGSAGGSLTYDLAENLVALRVIDGTGRVQWVEQGTDLFNAWGVSLGLLGIISRVRFRLTPRFSIHGQQITRPTRAADCPIDLFGNGDAQRPSMRTFLEQTHYARLLWWPQRGLERMVIWQAARAAPPLMPALDPVPYLGFSKSPLWTAVQQLFGAILFTPMGNRGFAKCWKKLKRDYARFAESTRGPDGKRPLLATILLVVLYVVGFLATLIFSVARPLLKPVYRLVVSRLQPNTKPGEPLQFQDHSWRSLPMDNGADDILLGTEFTELFVPIEHTARAMTVLGRHFNPDDMEATGFHATELYAGHRSDFWLSPAYGGACFRIDPFWYINSDGDPDAREGFFGKIWELFVKEKIPFRLHWGKFLPGYDHARWAAYLRSQYPKWEDFMTLRRQSDPDDIFFTDYWRRHLSTPQVVVKVAAGVEAEKGRGS